MKKMYGLILAMVAVSIIAGCKKDDPATIVGFWSGTYSGSAPWHVLFRSNGTVRVFDGADTATAGVAEGTYTEGDSVRAYYTFTPSMNLACFAGKVNAEKTSITGTWGFGTSTGGAGVMTLAK